MFQYCSDSLGPLEGDTTNVQLLPESSVVRHVEEGGCGGVVSEVMATISQLHLQLPHQTSDDTCLLLTHCLTQLGVNCPENKLIKLRQTHEVVMLPIIYINNIINNSRLD